MGERHRERNTRVGKRRLPRFHDRRRRRNTRGLDAYVHGARCTVAPLLFALAGEIDLGEIWSGEE
jgi:hypothetical protein